VDVAMATTCIPRIYHAAKVDGEFYWDGGLVANPAIYPLIYTKCAKDIIVVQLTKSVAQEIPTTAKNIHHRSNEISLNSNLIREMRTIYLITQLIDKGKMHKNMFLFNLHLIKDDLLFSELDGGSLLNMNLDFLKRLHKFGLKAGQKWIEENFDQLGKKIPFSDAIYSDYIKDESFFR
jgi:NTE family protein